METLKPLGNRALIKEDAKETVSAGGIVIPPTASDGKFATTARVIAIGRGRFTEKNILVEPTIKAGDHIVLAKYHGTEVKIEGEEYRIVDIDVIEGVIEEA